MQPVSHKYTILLGSTTVKRHQTIPIIFSATTTVQNTHDLQPVSHNEAFYLEVPLSSVIGQYLSSSQLPRLFRILTIFSQSPTMKHFTWKCHCQALSDNTYCLLSYHLSSECSWSSASLRQVQFCYTVEVVTFSQPLTVYTIYAKYPYALCNYHYALPLISTINSYCVLYKHHHNLQTKKYRFCFAQWIHHQDLQPANDSVHCLSWTTVLCWYVYCSTRHWQCTLSGTDTTSVFSYLQRYRNLSSGIPLQTSASLWLFPLCHCTVSTGKTTAILSRPPTVNVVFTVTTIPRPVYTPTRSLPNLQQFPQSSGVPLWFVHWEDCCDLISWPPTVHTVFTVTTVPRSVYTPKRSSPNLQQYSLNSGVPLHVVSPVKLLPKPSV